jgi:hypothetical protein
MRIGVIGRRAGIAPGVPDGKGSGTRTAAGTSAKMTLAWLFDTWRLQGRNALVECCALLAESQLRIVTPRKQAGGTWPSASATSTCTNSEGCVQDCCVQSACSYPARHPAAVALDFMGRGGASCGMSGHESRRTPASA